VALFRNISAGLRALFGKRQAEAELDDELRDYLEVSATEKMKRGMTRDQALRASRIEMGGVEMVKDEVREVGWEHWLETIWQDVRYALRMMRRTPVVTAMALLSLALGIGSNTAIFSLLDVVMLRSLPVQHPEELVQLRIRTPQDPIDTNPTFTNPIWEEVRDRADIFSGVFAWGENRFDLAQGGEAQPANAIFVSGSYFSTLGVQPAAGRLLTVADDQRNCSGAAVLSYGFWQDHYGGAANALGSSISLSRHSFPIVGVASPGFFGVNIGSKFDVAIPICAAAVFDSKPTRIEHRSWWWLNIMGRPKPGIRIEQVGARLGVLSPDIFAASVPLHWKPDMQKNFLKYALAVVPAPSGVSFLRRRYQAPLNLLLAIAGLVLLIACANIASLTLARAAARRKEFAARLALGASRARLIRQLLTECVLLSTLGAVVGVFFARWGSVLLVTRISTAQTKIFLDLKPDARILGFTAGIALLTGLLFGVLPAFRSTRVSLASAMKGGSAGEGEGRHRFRSGRWIVASQVGLSLVLLVAAGLFVRSFVKLVTLDLGFDRNNVLIVSASAKNTGLAPEQWQAVHDQVLVRLKSLPGVLSASRSLLTPIGGSSWDNAIIVEGQNAPAFSLDNSDTLFNFVSPGYFQTMRTQLLTGRDFNEHDTATSLPVAIINESLARKFFPHVNPLGQRFHVDAMPGEKAPSVEIVGIVRDAKYGTLQEDFAPTAFFPASQTPGQISDTAFELRSAARPSELAAAVQEQVLAVNKGMSLQFHTLAQQVDDSIAKERMLATLSGFFGALALLLAMIGLYGVLAYTVTQRQKEIGIRMALGAAPGSILRLVFSDVARVLAAGLCCGTVIVLATAKFVQKMLFGLEPRDATTLALAIGVLAGVALFAGYLPARRASRLDPMALLREE
jgi:putative ABC transport system permease protein